MIKNRIVAYGIYIAIFLLFWNALDYLSSLLTREACRFTVGADLVTPLTVAAVTGYILFLRQKGA